MGGEWRENVIVRSSWIFVCLFVALLGALTVGASHSVDAGASDAIVRLQPTTPGVQQIGHANISGAMIAGGFQGNGPQITNLNASNLTLGIVPDARLNVGGDLAGPLSTSNVRGLRGNPISPSAPTAGDFLKWNGSFWDPNSNGGSLTNLNASNLATGTVPDGRLLLGGDLLGQLSTAGVVGIRGRPISTTAPSTNDVLTWNGTQWAPAPGGGGGGGFTLPYSGTNNYSYSVFQISNASSGSGAIAVEGISLGEIGVRGTGRFGVRGESSDSGGAGVHGKGTNPSIISEQAGVQGESAGGEGRGVFGYATATAGLNKGVYGRTDSGNGYGVYGICTSTGGQNFGVYGETSSASGQAVKGHATAASGNTLGGVFVSDSPTGIGVQGEASYGASGLNYGVWGQASGDQARGVYGYAPRPSGNTYGGYFQADSDSGTGVFGFLPDTGFTTNYAVYGLSNSASGRGVYGFASGTNAGYSPYGVRGYCSTSSGGFAVYAAGDMGASGLKPFRIDHPLDPENKYLLHYATESPFPQNFYSGNIVTDGKGYAWIELPDYFEEINRNFKYQLTVVDESDSDQFIWAKVVHKIQQNRFCIRTNLPRVEVSWRVEADRNDLRVRFNRPTDVREKSPVEQGKYQHPEYYGFGPERGMDYDPVHQSTQAKHTTK